MKPEVSSLEALVPFETSYTLSKNVSAIQIFAGDGETRSRLGLITQLPEGAQVDLGGPGFNEKTVRVRCGGTSYFIFLEDLGLQRKRAASAGLG